MNYYTTHRLHLNIREIEFLSIKIKINNNNNKNKTSGSFMGKYNKLKPGHLILQ